MNEPKCICQELLKGHESGCAYWLTRAGKGSSVSSAKEKELPEAYLKLWPLDTITVEVCDYKAIIDNLTQNILMSFARDVQFSTEGPCLLETWKYPTYTAEIALENFYRKTKNEP